MVFIDDFRKDLSSPDISFIDAYVADTSEYYQTINSAKEEVAKNKDNCVTIDTISEGLLTKPNDFWHYDAYSMIKLGELFGQSVLDIK